jgi:ATP synthase protein I
MWLKGISMGEEDKEKKEEKKLLTQAAVFITVPFVIAVPPIIGWLIGRGLDHFFHTEPYFTFFMIFCGIIAGIRELYRLLKKYGEGL